METQIEKSLERIDQIFEKHISKLMSFLMAHYNLSDEYIKFHEKFQSTKFHGTIPHAIPRLIGLSFEMPAGNMLHLKVDEEGARTLVTMLNDFLSSRSRSRG